MSNTADDEGETGVDPFHGHGFVNAGRAVGATVPAAAANPAPRQEITPPSPALALVVARNGSPSPSVAFDLPAEGRARVELFDVSGRRVAVLFDGLASRGRTTLAWDVRGSSGQALRQGAYFARLTSGQAITSRRLVLIGS